MEIGSVSLHELRKMKDSEGLVLQGCGGDLQEWVNGINDMLTESGILQNGSKFEKAYTFKNGDLTCLLFPFKDVQLDVGKLAIWRLQTHEQFGGTWLSDYVENSLGGFVNEENTQERTKPDCPLIGADSNIFSLMGIASRTLRQNGMGGEAKEMCEKITSCGSYTQALAILGDYVNIVSVDEYYGNDEDYDEDYDEDEVFEMKGGME